MLAYDKITKKASADETASDTMAVIEDLVNTQYKSEEAEARKIRRKRKREESVLPQDNFPAADRKAAFRHGGAKAYAAGEKSMEQLEGACDVEPNMDLHQSVKPTHRNVVDTDTAYINSEVDRHSRLHGLP